MSLKAHGAGGKVRSTFLSITRAKHHMLGKRLLCRAIWQEKHWPGVVFWLCSSVFEAAEVSEL